MLGRFFDSLPSITNYQDISIYIYIPNKEVLYTLRNGSGDSIMERVDI